jgi:hypothetical protein
MSCLPWVVVGAEAPGLSALICGPIGVAFNDGLNSVHNFCADRLKYFAGVAKPTVRPSLGGVFVVIAERTLR